MPSLSQLLYDFSNLSISQQQRQKADYLHKLKESYRHDPTQTMLALPSTATGIKTGGAELIGDFLRDGLPFHAIQLPSHHFYNPKLYAMPQKKDAADLAFACFIEGLAETKRTAKLTELDLSKTLYPLSWLVKLAEEVVCDHPSLTVIHLSTIQLTDEMMLAMLPFLRSPVLQAINLRGNRLTSACLNDLSLQLKNNCPALTLLDLTANPMGLRTEALKTWLQSSAKLSICYPEDRELHALSLRHYRQDALPHRLSSWMPNHPDQPMPSSSVDTSLLEQLTIIKQEWAREQERTKHALFQSQQEIRNHLASVQGEVKGFEVRMATIESDNVTCLTTLGEVQMTLAAHETLIDESAEKLNELEQDLQDLMPIIEELQRQLSSMSVLPLSTTDTPSLSYYQVQYVNHLTQVLVRMYLAAMVVSTGLVPLQMKTSVGKVANLFDQLSRHAPMGTGIVLKIISVCCDAVDKRLVDQRIARLLNVAISLEEMTQRAQCVAKRLAQCLSYHSPLKEGILNEWMKKMASGVKTMGRALLQQDIDKMIVTVVEEGVNHTLNNNSVVTDVALEEAQQQAEEHAQMLLTLIMTVGVVDNTDVDVHAQLFLYAAPLLTMADEVFLLVLAAFCQQQSQQGQTYTPDAIEVNQKKRHLFTALLSGSWRQYPEAMTDLLADPVKRPSFFAETAEEFNQLPLFYLTQTQSLPVLFNDASLNADAIDRVTESLIHKKSI